MFIWGMYKLQISNFRLQNMTKQNQQFLLKLARQTLKHYFDTGKILDVSVSNKELNEKLGTFVTLHKNSQLRGCIGHIEPVQEVYKDVIDNALSAAFDDPRFNPLQKDELKDVVIEISVLTQPQKLIYTSIDDLLNKLQPLRDGVVIKKGRHGATYLPQVWEDLANKEDFLSSLCEKAGLPTDEWRTCQLEVLTYQAEVFYES